MDKYTVKSGDTLSTIANSYGVSVADLITWNSITDPNKLSIGQELIVSPRSKTGKKDTSQTVVDARRKFSAIKDSILSFLFPAHAILKGAAPNASMFVHDLYRHNVSVPVRKALGIEVQPYIETGVTFNPAFRTKLVNIADSVGRARYPNYDERLAQGDTLRFHITGDDYNSSYAAAGLGPNQHFPSMFERLTSPMEQISTSLGSFDVQSTKNNITVSDIYEFKTDIKTNEDVAGTYAKIREKANTSSTPVDAPDNEKIHVWLKIPRKIKINK